MRKITIEDVLNGTKGSLISGDLEDLVAGVSIDSRHINEKDMYVALRGERVDGHDFISGAIKNGATTILIEKEVEEISKNANLNFIRVEDTYRALMDLAEFYIGKFNIPVVGVTGSVGKTSTKDMVYYALSKGLNTHRTIGNFNNHVGLPLTVFKTREDTKIAVLEMGMDDLGQIHDLSKISRPQVGVITNIGLSHIERLGSQENILKAKLEILDYMKKDGLLLVNGDDAFLKDIEIPNEFRMIKFGFDSGNDLKIVGYEATKDGISVKIELDNKVEEFVVPALGRHNAYNVLAAVGVAREFGIELDTIREGFKLYEATPMRLEVKNISDMVIINDAYNASVDSMKAALDVLSDFKGRKIAILGDMLEMGEFRESAHREVGIYAKEKADIIFTIGNDSRYINDECKKVKEAYHFEEKIDMIDTLKSILKKDDVILLKGSRGMRLEEVEKYL